MESDEGREEERSPALAALLAALQTTQRAIVEIEPAAPAATKDRIASLRTHLLDLEAKLPARTALSDAQRDDLDEALAHTYLGAAMAAIAAGESALATEWIGQAEKMARADDIRAEVAAAKAQPEAFRELSHGRYLFGRGKEREARKRWEALAKTGPKEIAGLANIELSVPRALRPDESPSLWRINGCGLGFYGSRDRWRDGSYATTQCISLVFVPVLPLRAYRVIDRDGGYVVLAREQLSRFAKAARLAVVAAVLLLVLGAGISSYLNDPVRLARARVEEVLRQARAAQPQAAVEKLTALVDGGDLEAAGEEVAARAGASLAQRSAELVAAPTSEEGREAIARWTARLAALPEPVRGGAARQAALAQVEAWLAKLEETPSAADARLELLRHGALLAGSQSSDWHERARAQGLTVAKSLEADHPLEALGVYVDLGHEPSLANADALVAAIAAASPSLLLDAEEDIQRWAAARPNASVRDSLEQARRARAAAGLAPAGAEASEAAVEPNAADLAAALRERPWDQHAALALAQMAATAGRTEEATRQLEGLGRTGWVLRDARMALGYLQRTQGKLVEAEVTFAGVLGRRVARFLAATADLERVTQDTQERLVERIRSGDIPSDVRTKVELTSDEEEQRRLLTEWLGAELSRDAKVVAGQARAGALFDVVPASIALGMVKLERAQKLPEGSERISLLLSAERTFLAIRSSAEGQPRFRIALGEIYARLGKEEASEAELAAVLSADDPALALTVANVYRNLGKVSRATEVARSVYEHASATAEQKSSATIALALLANTLEDAEAWYRKSDTKSPFVRNSLLQIDATKAMRRGDGKECAAKFVQVAKAHLAETGADVSRFNNAAVAYRGAFMCSGDLSMVDKARASLEKAYRLDAEDAVVTANYEAVLELSGMLRVLGKRIDFKRLPIQPGEAFSIVSYLATGQGEAEALRSELTQNPDLQRAVQLSGTYELLAASSPEVYRQRFRLSRLFRDVAEGEAVVARARKAKTIDRGAMIADRERWYSGAADDEVLGTEENAARYQRAIADPGANAKTKAVASLLLGLHRTNRGVYKGQVETQRMACADFAYARATWPALAAGDDRRSCLVDVAALEVGAKEWATLRRRQSTIAAVQHLARRNDPAAAAIMASKEWSAALAEARADASPLYLEDLRMARLAGDAALENKARPALDDRLRRLDYELDLLLDPGNEAAKSALELYESK